MAVKIDIEHIQIAPNPVKAKNTYQISIKVTDREIIYAKEADYADEIRCGQKIGVM